MVFLLFLAVTTSLTQGDVLLTKQTSSSVSVGDSVSKMFVRVVNKLF